MLLPAILLATAQVSPCDYDRAAMLALDQHMFDQDPNTGWRSLDRQGCEAEAADLIRAYRNAKESPEPSILYWHEGQVRAGLGQTEQAIALFEKSRTPIEKFPGWNSYVDGSVAYLRRDLRGLRAARERLANLPPPEEPPIMQIGGENVEIPWPPNLNVLDAFIRCFDRPYKEAYACAVPMWTTNPPGRGQ